MSTVILNKQLSKDFYLMEVSENNGAEMGQFYMLRSWGLYPVLSRPISVFDSDGDTVSFLYKVVGQGTEMFTGLKQGDAIDLQGPYGEPFPKVGGNIALVGGGVGIAPLFLAAKTLKQSDSGCKVDLFLGFSDAALLEDEYKRIADNVTVNVGGFVTDDISPEKYDHIFTCGPEIMMRVLFDKCKKSGLQDRLWVSMEKRMACGVGACLVCSCATKQGNRKTCKDGPVFKAEAVFDL